MTPDHLRRGAWAVDTYTKSILCADPKSAREMAARMAPIDHDVWIVTPAGVPMLYRG